MTEPIRLWLWLADGSSAGELVIQPTAVRPSWITLNYSAVAHGRIFDSGHSAIFRQDPADGNMYREVQ